MCVTFARTDMYGVSERRWELHDTRGFYYNRKMPQPREFENVMTNPRKFTNNTIMTIGDRMFEYQRLNGNSCAVIKFCNKI